ncbi:hypothetical protein F4778DRAFT_474138 [Xylariomycetidae sp. FL2044]|nr:hypothetical protein F4778DRAFT_474138 [Xylariomycetidae sp. FL2044]
MLLFACTTTTVTLSILFHQYATQLSASVLSSWPDCPNPSKTDEQAPPDPNQPCRRRRRSSFERHMAFTKSRKVLLFNTSCEVRTFSFITHADRHGQEDSDSYAPPDNMSFRY